MIAPKPIRRTRRQPPTSVVVRYAPKCSDERFTQIALFLRRIGAAK